MTAALFASGALCHSASGLATALFLMDYVHLFKPKPWQDEAGSHWHASPLRKRNRVHHEWWTTKSPHSRHGSTPVGPPRLSTTAAKAIFKLLISRKEVCVRRIPSLPVTPSPWLLLHGKGLPQQGTTASLFLTPLPSPTSPGKGFLQPGGGSGCSCFWERVSGVLGVGIDHGCSPESGGSSSSSSEPRLLPLSATARIQGRKIPPNFISHFDSHFLYVEMLKTCPLRATTKKNQHAGQTEPRLGLQLGGMRRYRVPQPWLWVCSQLCTLIAHLRAQGRAGSDLGSPPTVTTSVSLCHATSRTSHSKDHGR